MENERESFLVDRSYHQNEAKYFILHFLGRNNQIKE